MSSEGTVTGLVVRGGTAELGAPMAEQTASVGSSGETLEGRSGPGRRGRQLRRGHIPAGGSCIMVAMGWPCGTNVPRTPPMDCSAILPWRDVMWVDTLAALRWNPRDPARRRLGGGHRFGGKRRWDAPLQKVLADARWPDSRQDLAHDTERWRVLEHAFAAQVTRVKRHQPVPAVRHQTQPTPDV